jgi:hypothetical protein
VAMKPRRLSSIPAPDSAPESRARLHDLSSEIAEIRRALPHSTPAGFTEDDELIPSTMPTGGWARLAGVLTEMAVHHVVVQEIDAARRAANDALLLIDMIEEDVARAELSITLGEVLVSVHEAHRARERFETAIAVFDARKLLASAARARVGLARSMTMLHDPVARALYEDAGTVFEDLGDEDAVRMIDIELREIEAELEESPTSFQASYQRVRITPKR